MADGLVSRLKTTKYKDALIMALLFAAVWLLRLYDLSAYPIPLPILHDELANLLGAQTFALGRLSNPPHPLCDFFLQVHVLCEPMRMMKYQPLHAAFMALGIVISAHVYWGVVCSAALAVSASYWAARGWLARPASLCVALFFLLLLRAPHYSINSYWGFNSILLGAFLLLGAYPRLIQHRQFSTIYAAILGAAIVMLSRPYEGLLLVATLAIAGFLHIHQNFTPPEKRRFFAQCLAPCLVFASALLAFQLYYNHAITGHYLTMPYMAYDKQYGVTPIFWIGDVRQELFSSHYGMEKAQHWELKSIAANQLQIIPTYFFAGFKTFLGFTNPPTWLDGILALAAWVLPFSLFYRNVKAKKYLVLHVALLIQLIGISMITWLGIGHYTAVYFVIYAIIIAVNMRDAYHNASPKLTTLYKIAAIVAATSLPVVSHMMAPPNNMPVLAEQIAAKQLNAMPGKHLLFVDHRPAISDKTGGIGWISNPPDIDQQQVISAWYLSVQENQQLIAYYPDRTIWYIEPYGEQKLMPYQQHLENK